MKKIFGYIVSGCLAASVLSVGAFAQNDGGIVGDVVDGAENIVDSTVDGAENIVDDVVGGAENAVDSVTDDTDITADDGAEDDVTIGETDVQSADVNENPATDGSIAAMAMTAAAAAVTALAAARRKTR